MQRFSLVAFSIALATAAFPVLFGPDASSASGVLTATIHRDAYGVPHIFADDAYALWYANGYVQAQDRLWAMDLLRHLGYGEASRVVGPSVLFLDLSTRRDLYTRVELQTMLDTAPARLVEAITAYTDGVNRAAAEMTAAGNLPAEFEALQHPFEPWTPLDTAAVATFLLARFGTGGGDEIGNAKLLARLKSVLPAADAEDAFADVVWGLPTTAYATIQSDTYANAGLMNGPLPLSSLLPEQAAATAAAAQAQTFGLGDASMSDLLASTQSSPFAALEHLKWGSNALLVAPSRSATGQALVGGGPQMGYFNPQIPYEVGLHGAGIDAVGIGVAGAPGIVLGRTSSFAWTVTSGISDQTDTVALPAGAGPRTYVWDGDERALECRTETHTVANPAALTGVALSGGPQDETYPAYAVSTLAGSYFVVGQEVCRADVGGTPSPVVAVTLGPGGDPAWYFAQRSASALEEVRSADQWLFIAAESELDGFRSHFDQFAFTFNFHFAGFDASWDEVVCYHHVGRQPLRDLALDARLPTPAGDAHLWSGYLQGVSDAQPDLPRDCNTTEGYYAQWNNLPMQGWSSGDSRELWGSIHRVERLDQEFHDFLADDEDDLLTLDDVKTILRNAATHDSLAAQIVPAILAVDAGTAPAAKAALEAWAADDHPWRAGPGDLYTDAGHTVYDRLLPALLARVLGDEQGSFIRSVNFDPSAAGEGDPHAADHGEHNNQFGVLVDALDGTSAYDWCLPMTCDEAVEAAYADAGLDAYATVAEIPLTSQHRTTFTSLGLGPAYTMPMTNRATYYHFHVGTDIGTATAPTSGSAIAPGQSGHVTPFDAFDIVANPEGKPRNDLGPTHMRDQLPLYVGFGFKPVPVTAAQAAAVSPGPAQTLLIPSV